MKIGNTELKYGLFLAPMAGDTDRAMREICRMHGAEYTVTEMVSSKAISFGDKKSIELGRLQKDELPASIQLFGHEPDIIAKSALEILKDAEINGAKPTAFDINMGCPVKKIVQNGEGSALMKSPDLAYETVKTLKAAVDIPVTVKIRTGWDAQSKNAPAFAETLQKAGADMICVHGRTRSEMYAPPVDYETVKNVKKSVSVPVVGNGGIYDSETAQRMLETGVDGLMIGRGALGNPWIFEEIKCFLDGKTYERPSRDEIVKTALFHLKKSCEYKDERLAVLEGRRHVAYYLKGFNGAPYLRDALCRCNTYSEVFELMKTAFNEI